MTTKIYGASDDLIETEGDYKSESGCYHQAEKGVLIIVNDGSLLLMQYPKADLGVWGITVIKQGNLFDKIEYCTDEDADPSSDVAFFKDGVKYIYCAKEWEKME